MPAKNRVKIYVEGGVYHVYNRGVEKRRIFMDGEDYSVFLELLKHFLSPSVVSDFKHPLSSINAFHPVRPRPLANLSGEVDLIAYCLMPNHFHLLLKQKTATGMITLMRKILTTYVLYFNRKHKRVGHLFQGSYKAALIETEPYLLHVSRYIHQNPNLTKGHLDQYPYSSYPNFIGEKKEDWVKPQEILDFFKKSNKEGGIEYSNYQEFVENFDRDPIEIIPELLLED